MYKIYNSGKVFALLYDNPSYYILHFLLMYMLYVLIFQYFRLKFFYSTTYFIHNYAPIYCMILNIATAHFMSSYSTLQHSTFSLILLYNCMARKCWLIRPILVQWSIITSNFIGLRKNLVIGQLHDD